MIKESKTRKTLNSIVSAVGIVLATVAPAFANNGPGPLAFFSIFSLIILIVALTFAGGGYGVAKRLDDAKHRSKFNRTIINILEFIAGVVLFFVGIFASVLGVVGFSIYAIARGVKMIKWSKAAEKKGARPTHLEGANPKRLRSAGVLLIVLTLLVFGYSLFNIEDVTGTAEYRKRGYVSVLNSDARNARTTAMAYLEDDPKAVMVTCAELEKAGFKPYANVTCFSDMTAASGSIRMTGPEKWGLTKPVAVITYSGELTPAER